MTVLASSDLLPHIVQHLTGDDRYRVREWCRGARSNFDARLVSRLRLSNYNRSGKQAVVTTEQAFKSACGIIGRGFSPEELTIDFRSGYMVELRQETESLLRLMAAQATDARPNPTTSLTLTARLLSPAVAQAAAAAFPCLIRLRLEEANAPGDTTAEALLMLLSCDAEGGGVADDGSSRTGPLAPALHFLELVDIQTLPPTYVTVLPRCGQLRELALPISCHGSFRVYRRAALERLAGLTQLQSLQLSTCNAADLPVLFRLTGLTSLGFGLNSTLDLIKAGPCVPMLARLRDLRLVDTAIALSCSAWSELVALTSLEAQTLAPPLRELWGPGRPCDPSGWRLPPHLCRLVLHGCSHDVAALARVQLPASLTCIEFTSHPSPSHPSSGLTLDLRQQELHVSARGQLLPAGEAVLRKALGLLVGPLVRPHLAFLRVQYSQELEYGPRELAGCHRRWLVALRGAAGLEALHLGSVKLGREDLAEVVQHHGNVQELDLHGPVPERALSLLARMPRLRKLSFCTDAFQEGSGGPVRTHEFWDDGGPDPPDAARIAALSAILLELCTAAGPRLATVRVQAMHPSDACEALLEDMLDLPSEVRSRLVVDTGYAHRG
ncbi:hypothetical protein TSOC_005600 [Tetrabaena socialis]|uniref:F-box domain-containing protein n=1 Tax=Tetrabaena socialis TaxID=47790 RepID=A0A2J8A5V3_9CHLO|nr:hypothetical protein TSOC_005600 [Tetrabaena socialis]|eukprot:PNH07906.1 hypothetical protein TSOC_005600 [Tetrabaena socialis]